MYKQILRLALPNIITNITVPLLGMVDLAIVGHIGDTRYIGAIAIATMIFSMIYWLFGFLRMGTSGFTAQAYGADDMDESADILFRSLSVGLTAALCLIVLQTHHRHRPDGCRQQSRAQRDCTTILLRQYMGCPCHTTDVRLQRVVYRYAKFQNTDDDSNRCQYS